MMISLRGCLMQTWLGFVCLLILLHNGFMGYQNDIVVPDSLLRLVKDLDLWNIFHGSYVWVPTSRFLMR